MSPQINLTIVALKSLRGEEGSSANMVRLTQTRSPFLISIVLEGEDYVEYRITVLDGSGRIVWKRGGLRRDSHDLLSVGFNSSFFRPGRYLFKVEGISNGGDVRPVGDYPLRIVK